MRSIPGYHALFELGGPLVGEALVDNVARRDCKNVTAGIDEEYRTALEAVPAETIAKHPLVEGRTEELNKVEVQGRNCGVNKEQEKPWSYIPQKGVAERLRSILIGWQLVERQSPYGTFREVAVRREGAIRPEERQHVLTA